MYISKKKVLKLAFNFLEVLLMLTPIVTICFKRQVALSGYCDILFLLRLNVYTKFSDPVRD